MIEVKRMKTENAWKKYADKKPVFDFCEGYKEFMSLCKTERECTDEIIKQAKKAGFKNLDTVIEKGVRQQYGKGTGSFCNWRKTNSGRNAYPWSTYRFSTFGFKAESVV